MNNLLPVLPLLGIALFFWLLFVRPAQRRNRTMGQMQRDLSVGDEVMLTSGIIGVLRALDGETVELEVSEGVTVKVVRQAVGRVVTPTAHDGGTELAADVADEPEEK